MLQRYNVFVILKILFDKKSKKITFFLPEFAVCPPILFKIRTFELLWAIGIIFFRKVIFPPILNFV
jgi:hypothetical protein